MCRSKRSQFEFVGHRVQYWHHLRQHTSPTSYGCSDLAKQLPRNTVGDAELEAKQFEKHSVEQHRLRFSKDCCASVRPRLRHTVTEASVVNRGETLSSLSRGRVACHHIAEILSCKCSDTGRVVVFHLHILDLAIDEAC